MGAAGLALDWRVPDDYPYDVPTCVAHRHRDYIVPAGRDTSAVSAYDPKLHGEVYGEFAYVRRTLDYSWHTNYTPERQAWQDALVRSITRGSPLKERPWVIFTCGAMGAGKGHVMSWLASHEAFPLKDLVCIDPDKFKCVMPEWAGYVEHSVEDAGTMCHKESGLLQEIAQEVAMRAGRHLWIDGSLADHRWYTGVFNQMRSRFPQYRLGIIHVHCSEQKVYERAERRGRQTGRFVPEELLKASIEKTRDAIKILGPLADFVAQVDNEDDPPWLSIEMEKETCTADDFDETQPLICGQSSCEARCPFGLHCPVLDGPLFQFVSAVNHELHTPWIRVCCKRSGFSVPERALCR